MSIKPKIVFLDVDGVIVDHNHEFLEELNRIAGSSYRYEDLTDFWYHNCFPEEHADIIDAMWHRPDLYDGREPDPEAMKAIEEMRTFARVVAFSTPTPGHIASKYAWLMGIGFHERDIILLRDKSLGRGTVHIDDRIKNLTGFSGAKICFERPWNTKWDESMGLRTNDWDKIVEEVRRLVTT